jgi:hypothetical protein
MAEFIGAKRFLGDQIEFYKDYVKAAKEYPHKVKWNVPIKPFGDVKYYCIYMQNLLDVIQAMHLPNQSRILEVGVGPGWITEILMGLNYIVDAIEPADKFIKRCKKKGKIVCKTY